MAPTTRLIKKYPNRRLYDTQTSAYITLADIKQLVLDGESFQVQDAKTQENLTRSILLQIILDRLNLNWDERYLFEANFRRDGSSRFIGDNRWGNFPSFSAAWRISEEPFMKLLQNQLIEIGRASCRERV